MDKKLTDFLENDFEKLLKDAFRPAPGQEKTLLVVIPADVPVGQEEKYARKWIRDVCEKVNQGETMKKMEDGVVVVGREDLATGNENCPAKDVAFNMLRDDRMLHEADTVVFREKKTEVVLKAPVEQVPAEEPPEGGTTNEEAPGEGTGTAEEEK